MPVGFKWFVPGLVDGSLGFGGEESAGASFLRKDGTVWTTDKDGIILDLLAAEITRGHRQGPRRALRGADRASSATPSTSASTPPPAARQKALAQALARAGHAPPSWPASRSPAKLTTAPGNGAPIGGLKVITENGWFAARPSGTEDVYKIYAESFKGPEHLAQIQSEAREVVSAALNG